MDKPREAGQPSALIGARLPKWAPYAAGAAAVAVALGHALRCSTGPAGEHHSGWPRCCSSSASPLGRSPIEGRRRAKDRFASTLIYASFVAAVVPLILILFYIGVKGFSVFSADFFTQVDERGDQPAGGRRAVPRADRHPGIGRHRVGDRAADRHLHRDLSGRVRPGEVRPGGDLLRRCDDRCAVDRGGPVRLHLPAARLRAPAVRHRRCDRAGDPDDPGRGAVVRGNAQAGAPRSARGVLRAGCAQVADHPQSRSADGDVRPDHVIAAGHRPDHRGDRAADPAGRATPRGSITTRSPGTWPPCR